MIKGYIVNNIAVLGHQYISTTKLSNFINMVPVHLNIDLKIQILCIF